MVDVFKILCRSLRCLVHQFEVLCRPLRYFSALRCLEGPGIYRDNLSAIVIGDNLLAIIVIAQNSFDLSITDIAFVIYSILLSPINYREKRFFMHTVFKLRS